MAVTLPNSIANGDALDATEVMGNFNEIVTAINSDVILKDGTIQMTGQLSLKASTDPTADDHAARKKYVDDLVAAGTTRKGVTLTHGGLTTTSATAIPWDTEVADAAGFHAPAATAITIPADAAGVYAYTVSGYNASGFGSGSYWGGFKAVTSTGLTQHGAIGGIGRSAADLTDASLSGVLPLAVGDTVTFYLVTGYNTTNTTATTMRLEMYRVSA